MNVFCSSQSLVTKSDKFVEKCLSTEVKEKSQN